MLQIDRIELADIANPKLLAAAVLKQVEASGRLDLKTPIEEIALGCGITGIEQLETKGFEGALMTTATKADGVILVNRNNIATRQRFTVAHELGHFLNPWHMPPEGGFMCTAEDMIQSGGREQKNRQTMEAEANQFAAEILMPASVFMKQFRQAGGDLSTQVIQLTAESFAVSVLAAARRLADLREGCAVVLSQEGSIRQIHRGPGFPFITLQIGQPVPRSSVTKRLAGQPGDHSEIEETDTNTWTTTAVKRGAQFMEQVLIQAKGFKVTLLVFDESECGDDEDEWVRERSIFEPRFKQ